MDFGQYQAELQKWDTKGGEQMPTALVALGLAGEAGEVCDLIKKIGWHGKIANADDMAHELGDVLWYLQKLAQRYGFTLEQVAQMNVDKLQKRYPNGFVEGGGIR